MAWAVLLLFFATVFETTAERGDRSAAQLHKSTEVVNRSTRHLYTPISRHANVESDSSGEDLAKAIDIFNGADLPSRHSQSLAEVRALGGVTKVETAEWWMYGFIVLGIAFPTTLKWIDQDWPSAPFVDTSFTEVPMEAWLTMTVFWLFTSGYKLFLYYCLYNFPETPINQVELEKKHAVFNFIFDSPAVAFMFLRGVHDFGLNAEEFVQEHPVVATTCIPWTFTAMSFAPDIYFWVRKGVLNRENWPRLSRWLGGMGRWCGCCPGPAQAPPGNQEQGADVDNGNNVQEVSPFDAENIPPAEHLPTEELPPTGRCQHVAQEVDVNDMVARIIQIGGGQSFLESLVQKEDDPAQSSPLHKMCQFLRKDFRVPELDVWEKLWRPKFNTLNELEKKKVRILHGVAKMAAPNLKNTLCQELIYQRTGQSDVSEQAVSTLKIGVFKQRFEHVAAVFQAAGSRPAGPRFQQALAKLKQELPLPQGLIVSDAEQRSMQNLLATVSQ